MTSFVPSIEATSPFFLEAAVDAVLAFVANLEYWARFGQESGGEELEVLQNTRSRLPEMLVGGSCLPTHAIVYGGQDITPSEELLSPQNSALCMEPPLLAMAPFFLESPGSTRRKSSSGEGDANSIGSSLDSTHPPLPFHALLYGQGGSPPQHLSGCEPIFTKQPGNTLGRPIFLSSASYEEDEEYSFRPTSLFRDAEFGGTENDSTTSPFDTSSSKTSLMPMADSSFSFIPFFVEFENESEDNSPPKTWKKVDACTGHRGGSASWSFLRIIAPRRRGRRWMHVRATEAVRRLGPSDAFSYFSLELQSFLLQLRPLQLNQSKEEQSYTKPTFLSTHACGRFQWMRRKSSVGI
eukprot:CAMPEP_0185826400 /NCGR_PEP_ID=MMETSP1322-20130828/31528_1 /TAXON_ID=265543 /ORGANISM="Minutocellus polymorphus, Strain RCC2270" /LENGTH=351 /DNA_ID=CAMNT_0028524127 /DNA_START=1061 /DNA_END=2116 /DNA_ORIENTATION=+